MHVAPTARYAGQVAQKTNCSLVVDDISTSLPDNGLKTAIRRIIAHSGIEDFSFHDRRHTVLTRLALSGWMPLQGSKMQD
jgi:hypothetical protein